MFCGSLNAIEYTLSSTKTTNGKTIFVEFKKYKNIKYKYVKIDKNRYTIFQHPKKYNKMYALLPVSYYEKPKNLKAVVYYIKSNNKLKESFFIKVNKGKYASEKIQVQKSKVKPKVKKINKRIGREYAEAMKIYSTHTNFSYIKKPFALPMKSKITSVFGKARVYNGILNGFHSGTDFRAKIGTPVTATNAGIIALAKDRFYSGVTVIINHGNGIYSVYYHLSLLNVSKGDVVKKNQLLGLSGSTGRVTGPHLHFGFRVSGLQVDPLQFIKLVNQYIYF